MARRMFSPKIVSSDQFLDMPVSARELYFQLGMYADDDGFVNPKRIMRMVGASDDDLRVLTAKEFVIPFKSGVVVITHWKVNNLIRKDWYQQTMYIEEQSKIDEDLSGKYFLGNKMLTSSVTRGKYTNLSKLDLVQDVNKFFDEMLWPIYPKKIAKEVARKAIVKLLPDTDLRTVIVQGVEKGKNSDQWRKNDGQFVPHLATWINQKRWEDEITVEKNYQTTTIIA